jgi:hypothetical protein
VLETVVSGHSVLPQNTDGSYTGLPSTSADWVRLRVDAERKYFPISRIEFQPLTAQSPDLPTKTCFCLSHSQHPCESFAEHNPGPPLQVLPSLYVLTTDCLSAMSDTFVRFLHPSLSNLNDSIYKQWGSGTPPLIYLSQPVTARLSFRGGAVDPGGAPAVGGRLGRIAHESLWGRLSSGAEDVEDTCR